ncbi:hypothetical protein PTKIN_Ptkin14bG0110100 [Pterospermum kingtungense]
MVTAACYTPDGQGALVGSYKGSCHLYNTSDSGWEGVAIGDSDGGRELRSRGDKRFLDFETRPAKSQLLLQQTENILSLLVKTYVYVWKHEAESQPGRNKGVTVTQSYEHFHCKDVMGDACGLRDTQLRDQNCFDDNIDEVSTANHPPTPIEEYSGNEGSLSASYTLFMKRLLIVGSITGSTNTLAASVPPKANLGT